MNVIENKIPKVNFYIEPLGNAWGVYSFSPGGPDRTQEDVFTTLDEARKYLAKRRGPQS